MPISSKPWGNVDKTVEAYGSAEKYCRACLIDLNEPREEKIAGKCKLPVREPNGAINRNALAAAAVALAGGRTPIDAPLSEKRKAAKKLITLYREADIEPPESLKRLAGVK